MYLADLNKGLFQMKDDSRISLGIALMFFIFQCQIQCCACVNKQMHGFENAYINTQEHKDSNQW